MTTEKNRNSGRYLMVRPRENPQMPLYQLVRAAVSRCDHKATICEVCLYDWTTDYEIHWYRTTGGRKLADTAGISHRNLGPLVKGVKWIANSLEEGSLLVYAAVGEKMDNWRIERVEQTHTSMDHDRVYLQVRLVRSLPKEV